jgi:hypothetical protein
MPRCIGLSVGFASVYFALPEHQTSAQAIALLPALGLLQGGNPTCPRFWPNRFSHTEPNRIQDRLRLDGQCGGGAGVVALVLPRPLRSELLPSQLRSFLFSKKCTQRVSFVDEP